METETNDWALFAVMFPFGLLLFVGGLLVYKQKMVPPALDDRFPGKPSLACTFLGMWLMLLPASNFREITSSDIIFVPYALLTFACQGIGILGWLWMPKFMQPAWLKEADRLKARGKVRRIRQYVKGKDKR